MQSNVCPFIQRGWWHCTFFRPLNIHLAGCLSPTLCSGHDRGPFDLSLSNHAWFCCGLSILVTLGLVHDTGSYSFVFSFPCSFAVTLWIPMAVHMYLLVNKILLLNVSAVQRLLEMFLSIFVIRVDYIWEIWVNI